MNRVGLVVVAHQPIARSLLRTVETLTGGFRQPVVAFDIALDFPPDQAAANLKRTLGKIDAGMGVVVLVDQYGATPSNIARMVTAAPNIVIHGLNMAMLLRAQTYAEQPIHQLVETLVVGARNAVFAGEPTIS